MIVSILTLCSLGLLWLFYMAISDRTDWESSFTHTNPRPETESPQAHVVQFNSKALDELIKVQGENRRLKDVLKAAIDAWEVYFECEADRHKSNRKFEDVSIVKDARELLG